MVSLGSLEDLELCRDFMMMENHAYLIFSPSAVWGQSLIEGRACDSRIW